MRACNQEVFILRCSLQNFLFFSWFMFFFCIMFPLSQGSLSIFGVTCNCINIKYMRWKTARKKYLEMRESWFFEVLFLFSSLSLGTGQFKLALIIDVFVSTHIHVKISFNIAFTVHYYVFRYHIHIYLSDIY